MGNRFDFLRREDFLNRLALQIAFNGHLANCNISDEALVEERLKLAVTEDLDMGAAIVIVDHQDREKCQDEVPDRKPPLFLFHRQLVFLSRLVISPQIGEEFLYRLSWSTVLCHFVDTQPR